MVVVSIGSCGLGFRVGPLVVLAASDPLALRIYGDWVFKARGSLLRILAG